MVQAWQGEAWQCTHTPTHMHTHTHTHSPFTGVLLMSCNGEEEEESVSGRLCLTQQAVSHRELRVNAAEKEVEVMLF